MPTYTQRLIKAFLRRSTSMTPAAAIEAAHLAVTKGEDDDDGEDMNAGTTDGTANSGGFQINNSGTTPRSDMPNPTGGDRSASGLDASRQVAESSTLTRQEGNEAAHEAFAARIGEAVAKSYLQHDGKLKPAFIGKAVADLLVEGGMSKNEASAIAMAVAQTIETSLDKRTAEEPLKTAPNFMTQKAETPQIAKQTDIAAVNAVIARLDDAGQLSLSERLQSKRLVNRLAVAKATGDWDTFRSDVKACTSSAVRDVFVELAGLPKMQTLGF